MAQKLHDQYGFDYNNLKVLLGGWSAWKGKNAEDPAGYPVESSSGAGAPQPPADAPLQVTIVVPTAEATTVP